MSSIDPGGQVFDSAWPFAAAVTISTDTTEGNTDIGHLSELCLCETPVSATRLDTVVENPFVINCRIAITTDDILATILRVTVVGNDCGGNEGTVGVTPALNPCPDQQTSDEKTFSLTVS